MAIAVAEKKHAVLGPSGWATWGSCPGSVPLSDGIIDRGSDYADEGTAAHQLLEDCLTGGFDADDLLGRKYTVNGKDWEVTRDMADAVNAAINIVKDILQQDESAVLQVEQSVPLTQMTGEAEAEGTCDLSIIAENGTHLYILDYKHGQGVKVYAREREGDPNGQFAMYALGWMHKHGFVYEDITKVTVGVIQPRVEHFETYTMTVEELRGFEDLVREAAGRVDLNWEKHHRGEELDLIPTDKGCRFCKAKHRCPALKSVMTNTLAVASSKIEDFEDLSLPKQAASVTIDHEIPADKLAEMMRAAPLIEELLKAVRAEVERRLFASEPVPGFKLVEGKKGNRQWDDEEKAIAELTKSGRLKMSEALQRKPISPTTAEKLFKGREKVWAQIAQRITQADGKPSVAPDSDKRPTYIPPSSAPEDFDDLTSEGAPLVIEAKATDYTNLFD